MNPLIAFWLEKVSAAQGGLGGTKLIQAPKLKKMESTVISPKINQVKQKTPEQKTPPSMRAFKGV